MTREIEIFGVIFVLFAILIFGIYFGINSTNFNFDVRNDAAGKTIFVESGQDLQEAIDSAAPSDAIFIKPGTYTPATGKAFEIRNKSIRILGSGREYTTLTGGSSQNILNITNSKISIESITVSGATEDGVKIDGGSNSEISIRDSSINGNSRAGLNAASKATIKTSIFDQNGSGIISTNTLTVENTIIKNSVTNGITISGTDSIDTNISNTVLSANKGIGIAVNGGRNNTITNVTVFDNAKGIVESVNTSKTTITNSIIQKNSLEGVTLLGANSTITYSNIFQNGVNLTPSSLSGQAGNISVDSGFIAGTDQKISSTSPVKDKGVESQKDADGSRIDMGAYGGSPLLLSANNVPQITSTPNEYIKPGQTYTYEIKATDPDGDALSYIVLNNNTPRWLTQENNKFIGTPTNSDIGYYGIIVVVTDKRGGNTVHPISINVLPDSRVIPTETVAPTTTVIPTVAQNVAPKVTIVSPISGTIFSKENNEIKWTINQGVSISQYVLSYSNNGSNFTTITTLPGTATSYKWTDVEKITSGKYFIKVEATDNGNPPVTVATTSQQFEVSNQAPDAPESITITKNSPADNDVVQGKRTNIVVEFKPDADIDRSKTTLKVNGSEVAYDITRNTIYYNPQFDYETSKIEVEVKLVTTKGGTASKQWIFNVQTSATPNDTTPDTKIAAQICLAGNTLCVPQTIGLVLLGLVILILLLLILYFFVKFIKTLRDQREGNLEAEFTEYYDTDRSAYPTPETIDPKGPTNTYDRQNLIQYYSTDNGQNSVANSDPQAQNSQLTASDSQQISQTTDSQSYDPNQSQQVAQGVSYENQNPNYIDQATQYNSDPNLPYDANQQQVSYQQYDNAKAQYQNIPAEQNNSVADNQVDQNQNYQESLPQDPYVQPQQQVAYDQNVVDPNNVQDMNSSQNIPVANASNYNLNQEYIKSLMNKYGVDPNTVSSNEQTGQSIQEFNSSDPQQSNIAGQSSKNNI